MSSKILSTLPLNFRQTILKEVHALLYAKYGGTLPESINISDADIDAHDNSTIGIKQEQPIQAEIDNILNRLM